MSRWYVFDANARLLHTATSEQAAQGFIKFMRDLSLTIYGVES